jgi:hypothetical protein
VACCLLITQRTPVLEREPQFVPQVHSCGRTVLKYRLKWSTAWWRGAIFYRHRSVDRWILTGWIDRSSIAYSSGFIVRISVRANPDDRIVVDVVSIGGHVRPSIGSVVAGCLTAAWNVVTEFLRSRGNSKSIIIMCRVPHFLFVRGVLKIIVVHHSSYCWAGCSRSSLCAAVNDDVLNRNCMLIGHFSS